MTTTADDRAFLEAICRDPADDTPRLVYADWLDDHAGTETCVECRGAGRDYRIVNPGCDTERDYDNGPCRQCGDSGSRPNGFRERAEFIRSQIATRSPIYAFRGGVTHSIRERNGWFPGTFEAGRAFWFTTSRGFIDGVECPAADWLTHSPAVAWRPGQTDRCVHCPDIPGKEHQNYPGGWERCEPCEGTGRVFRPLPPTAQPIEEVTLTEWPGNPWSQYVDPSWVVPLEWSPSEHPTRVIVPMSDRRRAFLDAWNARHPDIKLNLPPDSHP